MSDYKFSYYRTENNAEVDLIIEAPTGKVFAVEIKASDTPKNSELKGLKSFKTLVPKASLIIAYDSFLRVEEAIEYFLLFWI